MNHPIFDNKFIGELKLKAEELRGKLEPLDELLGVIEQGQSATLPSIVAAARNAGYTIDISVEKVPICQKWEDC